uniref:Uncharacterized protein n=1 Tax=Strigamia maritima TaxID=126957 RepID=T1IMX8_STRMM
MEYVKCCDTKMEYSKHRTTDDNLRLNSSVVYTNPDSTGLRTTRSYSRTLQLTSTSHHWLRVGRRNIKQHSLKAIFRILKKL